MRSVFHFKQSLRNFARKYQQFFSYKATLQVNSTLKSQHIQNKHQLFITSSNIVQKNQNGHNSTQLLFSLPPQPSTFTFPPF